MKRSLALISLVALFSTSMAVAPNTASAQPYARPFLPFSSQLYQNDQFFTPADTGFPRSGVRSGTQFVTPVGPVQVPPQPYLTPAPRSILPPPPPPPSAPLPPLNPATTGSCRTSNRAPAFYTVDYCALDRVGEPRNQILLGQAYFPYAGTRAYDFQIKDRLTAMGAAYTSEMFNINPNYLLALAIKQSRVSCDGYGDGCFRDNGQFDTVKAKFPLYFDYDDKARPLVQSFGPASVVVGLFARHSEEYWNKYYQYRSFYEGATDLEARAKLATRAYFRGSGETAFENIISNSRAQCRVATDVFQCFPTGGAVQNQQDVNAQTLTNVSEVVDYCRALVRSDDIYDTRLTRQDLVDFVERVLRPTFNQQVYISWDVIHARIQDKFNCLQSADGTISFRYDFKSILKDVKQMLPPVPTSV